MSKIAFKKSSNNEKKLMVNNTDINKDEDKRKKQRIEFKIAMTLALSMTV